METKALLILLSLYSQIHCGESKLDNPCGDWMAFKDEKCLKIFDQDFVDYADAENICKNEYEALLPSITTEEEQQFVESLLKSQNIVDNIWIGLKYVNGTYGWADGNKAQYTHWASGSPSNDSNPCVQMEIESNVFGYWVDVPCAKKNIVICEKLQLWSWQKLQTTIIEVMRNPVPIGFIYTQLPKEKAPQEIWPWMEWKDVSPEYAGLFFRTDGGNSEPFGGIQDESSPKLETVEVSPNLHCEFHTSMKVTVPPDGTPSIWLRNHYNFKYACNNYECCDGMRFTVSNSENRPRNTAIKIWKRTL